MQFLRQLYYCVLRPVTVTCKLCNMYTHKRGIFDDMDCRLTENRAPVCGLRITACHSSPVSSLWRCVAASH
jgi:hypothetical protein